MMDTVELLKQLRAMCESKDDDGKSERYPNGRGDYNTNKKNPRKGRVRIFPTIKDALKNLAVGGKFSTKGAGRIYTVHKRSKGGKDSESVVSGRVAKGYSPGSQNSSWGAIEKAAKKARSGKNKTDKDTEK